MGALFRPASLAFLFYAAAWAGAVGYLFAKGADWTFPLVSLGIFGIALSGLAWLLTKGARPTEIPVRRPKLELAALVVYLGLYATIFLVWGMGAARAAYPPGPAQETLVLAAKLVAHIVLPCILLALLGAHLRSLFFGHIRPIVFWRTLIVLGAIVTALLAVVSPSLKDIAALHPSTATLAWTSVASFAWIAVEAGLNEEFLFRAVLQSRLAAVLKSEWAAIPLGAILFALGHVPGLYLRGDASVDGWSTDPLQVVTYTIATLSPIALLFGLLWARTRCLLLIVLLHAAVDFLPNLSEFIGIWAR